ncbi:hypothetical protein BUALT_Bualt11G0118200 [Buddleja alternifolia]|uniref:Uncharacterized protein n=1 Tax=Buddleja alternifolia TaxID=168488 RepID=A0AAV6WVC8_9LAMI|nr:hypothetical protein BUALT_Bualt11G0118200 [Buddleja alternifolia]
MKTTTTNKQNSLPVSIPENASRNSWLRYRDDHDLDGDDGELVPPHVIIGRRVAGKMMAFSVCTAKLYAKMRNRACKWQSSSSWRSGESAAQRRRKAWQTILRMRSGESDREAFRSAENRSGGAIRARNCRRRIL